MGIFEEKVPKALLDAEVARRQAAEERLDRALERIDTLTDRISTMRRREKFDVPGAPKKPFLPKDVARTDTAVVQAAEQEFLDRYANELVAAGADPDEARAEAERVREEIGSMTTQGS